MDLDRYADRIGWNGAARPTEETLAEITFAHARAIPFENLDIHRNVPIRLEPEHVWNKLVERRRGGYCFEQNGLLLEVLRGVGFSVRPLAARVVYGPPLPRPRTHMLLLVTIGSRPWLADVGFGAHNMLGPLPFEPDRPHTIHGETFRVHDGALEVLAGETWAPLYRISLEEQEPIDFVAASWFTSTHPDSLFVQKRIASRVDVGKRWLLLDRELKIRDRGEVTVRTIAEAEYDRVLRDTFGLVL